MAIQMGSEENGELGNPTDPIQSKPVKRLRWATTKHKGNEGLHKRRSILNRLGRHHNAHEKRNSGATDPESLSTAGDANAEDLQPTGRRIFFNQSLPADARDEDGHPLNQYPRNKVRTAKYTALSFVPKNLWFQFHNIANVYFLFIIILGIFSIFGVSDPALAAVPLIVIIVLTAIKDAIEDTRRTIIDNELNNAPVYRLVDWSNVNTADEQVSIWRRFKKANTRAIRLVWKLLKAGTPKKSKKDDSKTYAERVVDARPSSETRRNSEFIIGDDDGGMEMTPVPSPVPGQTRPSDQDLERANHALRPLENRAAGGRADALQTLEVPRDKHDGEVPEIAHKNYGSLINPTKTAPGTARFKKECWKNVQVGDFVRLFNDEQIPADVAVISTADPDGACYVETKNLDGETNLKVRQALRCGQRVKRARDCELSEFVIESEHPQPNLYTYNGVARWLEHDSKNPDAAPREMAEPISINNMLLRGCSVRNTEWVLAVVVFTGDETKIMLNSGITPSKRAQISKDLNWNVVYNMIILLAMCLIAAVVEGTTWGNSNESLNFFEFGSYGGTPALNGFITFWAAMVLFQNLVPISLWISLEIVRTIQAFFIYSDTFMYYDKLDYPCTPKSWNISDDLGQIEYIFSDKTGTLTQNVMEFKKATINGVPYGEAYTEALAGMQKRQGIDVEVEGAKARTQIAEDRVKMLDLIRKSHNNPYLRDNELTFVAPDFISDLVGESTQEQAMANEHFMLVLALCHTVITERTPGDPPKIEFKAQSPDEAALVATARDCGFTVLGRNGNDTLVVNVLGQEREYGILNILEFNSSRKRMSAIMRMPNGKIMLFCKGADSVIYSRLAKGEQSELRKSTAEHLEMFAREGLRTLCIAQKEITEEEYHAWNKEHDLAAAAVQDRDEKLDEVSDLMERDLTLLGGTAIEDRLQDGVPDAISLLAQAGIKLWVLTGDKVETAINIGFSCNLLDNDMELIILKVEDGNTDQAEEQLDKHLASFGKTGSDAELKLAMHNHEPPAPTHALIIDGDTLGLVLDPMLKQKFLLLCKECRSVLCCRVSPAQKAAVVAMVKRGLDVITLSIGDGANDVAMIQEAHVGVGIAGEEGRQAVMSSDYAIGQFRYLTRLLLVHGRWSYRRMGECIANFFYKNIVWTFAIFWSNIYDNFDCFYIFDYSYILLYNLAFTSLPVIFMGVLDQDVSDKVSLAVPQLYRRGIERKEWTQTKFWLYMLDGFYQSIICFFFPYLLFSTATFNTEDGRNVNDNKRIGVYIANATVIVVNTYILLNTYRWDWFMVLISTISMLLIWLWTGAYTSFTAGFTFYDAAKECYAQASFWAVTFLVIIVCLLPRFSVKSFQKIFRPRDVDIIREQIRQGKFDYLKNVDPAKVAMITASEKPGVDDSAASSEISKPTNMQKISTNHMNEDNRYADTRPMYPPSVANTATTTHHHYSPHGSDGTDFTDHRASLDRAFPPASHGGANQAPLHPIQTQDAQSPIRPSFEIDGRPMPSDRFDDFSPSSPVSNRNSFDRPRPSFDRFRSSFEQSRTNSVLQASNDFTSAAYLSRVESSHSRGPSELRHEYR